MGEKERAVDCITFRRHKRTADVLREPRLQSTRYASDERDTRHSARNEAPRKRVHFARGVCDDFASDYVTLLCMVHHERRKMRVVARRSLVCPGDELKWIVGKTGHDRARKLCGCDPPIAAAQSAADRAQSKICATAFVGNWKAVTANADFRAVLARESNAARADNHDAAVSPPMRSDAGNRRIVNVSDRTERVRPCFELLKHGFSADAGKTRHRVHAGKRIGGKSRMRGGCVGGGDHGR